MNRPVSNLESASRALPQRPTPVWKTAVTLHTDFAQRVYKRAWDRLKADLYVLTVRTRASGMDEAAKMVEAKISEEFDAVRTDLQSDLTRTEVLMDTVKLTDLPTYKSAQTLEVEYSTPRAKEFLMLLQQLDQLLMRYDALWLTGVIETHPRVQRSHSWQRRLIKAANRIRELGNRTRVGINREIERRTQKTAVKPASVAPSEASTTDADTQIPAENTDVDLDAVDAVDDAALLESEHAAADAMVVVEATEGAFPEDVVLQEDALPSVDSSVAEEPVSEMPDAHLNGAALDAESVSDVATVERKRRRRTPLSATG